MWPVVDRLQPWCDEWLLAAGAFRIVGAPGPGGQEDVLLAVAETKLFMFAHEIGPDVHIAVEAPLRSWWRWDIVARSDGDTVPIKLAIDVTSSGERYDLESDAATGMPGRVTREILRLLDHPAEGAPSARQAAAATPKWKRARLGEIAGEIETELERLGWWMPNPPSEETVLGGGAFGMEAVPFPTWLQVVFVKRLRQAAAREIEIPRASDVATHAMREFDGIQSRDTSRLFHLLSEADQVVLA